MKTLEILSIILVALFAVFSLGWGIYKYNKKVFTLKDLIIISIFFLVSIVLCVSYQYSYNFFRYSLLADMILIYVAFLPFILFKLSKERKDIQKILEYVAVGWFLFLFILKLTFKIPFYELLPLNICNICLILIVIRPLYKSKVTDGYILCFGIIGCIMSFALGDLYSYTPYVESLGFQEINFFHPRVFESNVVHYSYLAYCIYFFLTKDLKATWKDSLKNFIWIIPLYYVLVFTNQIFKFNFFFNSEYRNPLLSLYTSLYTFAGFKIGFFKINLIYDVILIVGALGLLIILNFLLNKVQRRNEVKNELSRNQEFS
ncbi:MAG: YwaF family protein [Bacillales bacterium]|jgi:hypothetical protein|nr:YwaF family protein [Bacillales bacterium]